MPGTLCQIQGGAQGSPPRHRWLPYGILAVTGLLTLFAACIAKVAHQEKEQARLDNAVAETCREVDGLIKQHLILMDGLRGLVNARVALTRAQFYAFVESLQMPRNYPAVQGMGVILRIPGANKAQVIEAILGKTRSSFQIWPETAGGDVYPVIYLAPLNDRNQTQIGWDVATEPEAHAALERAVATGGITASGGMARDGHREFFLFAPLTWNGRAPVQAAYGSGAAAVGVYCPFRTGDFFRSLTALQRTPGLALRVYDGEVIAEENLLHATDMALPLSEFGIQRTLEVADHTWTLAFAPQPAFARDAQTDLTPATILGGGAVSLLLFGIGLVQSKSRSAMERQAAALRATEAEFRASFNSAAVGNVQADPETGRYLRVNPRFCEITGYGESELLTMTFMDLTHPGDVHADRLAHESLIKGDVEQLTVEKRYVRKDGAVIWVNLCASLIRDEAGRPIRTLAVVQDVTARREAEETVHAAETRFRTLVEQSIVGIYVIQGDRFVYVNPKMAEIFGCSLDELLNRPLQQFIHEEDRELVSDNVRKRLAGAIDSIHYTLRGLRKGGDVIDLEAHGARVEFNDGLAILGTLLDITERKEAEAQIRQLNAELEERVRERTAQLEQANHELESFSYSVSHDLRAPLRHVQGYVELLTTITHGSLPERAQRYLKTIGEASIEMGQLIDDLLGFSRMGKVEIAQDRVSLATVAQSVIDGLAPAAAGRLVQWHVEALPDVVGDPALLKQVLVNLLDNALKYSGGREPAVIEVGTCGEENGRVIIFVRDNGAGFDMQYAQKLFGVFQRLHRADEFEGTGIGLATVRRIVARHGGRTWAESKMDEGATFYFTLRPFTLS